MRNNCIRSLSVIFLLAIFSSCASTPKVSPQDALTNIRVNFLQGNYKEVFNYSKNLDTKSSNPDTLRALYYVGVSNLACRRYKEARKYFDLVKRNADNKTDFLDEVEVRIADSYYYDEDYSSALTLYQKIIGTYPDSSMMPSVYKKLNDICLKMGRFKQAEGYMETLTKKYPLSLEAQKIAVENKESIDYFTVQIGAFFDPTNAENLQVELQIKGYNSYIATGKKGKTTFYRVRVGRFQSKTEAQYIAERLEEEGYPTKIYP